MLDQLAVYLSAGQALHPALDWAVWFVWLTAPGVLLIGAVMAVWTGLTALTHATRRIARRIRDRRTRHHVPAAADNTPGTNPELLWHCRHILAATDHTRKEKP